MRHVKQNGFKTFGSWDLSKSVLRLWPGVNWIRVATWQFEQVKFFPCLAIGWWQVRHQAFCSAFFWPRFVFSLRGWAYRTPHLCSRVQYWSLWIFVLRLREQTSTNFWSSVSF